jgi:hypothetical protein
MQRIWADFNRLGLVEGEENVIPLGTEDSFNLRGHQLHDGERAVFVEEGSLEAEGVLQARQRASDGQLYWYAELDLSTLKHLDQKPTIQSDVVAS